MPQRGEQTLDGPTKAVVVVDDENATHPGTVPQVDRMTSDRLEPERYARQRHVGAVVREDTWRQRAGRTFSGAFVSWPLLIVEDDPDIRDALVEIFTARGYRPNAAGDGAQAIDFAKRLGVRPAVIVLDMVMPVMDGAEFLEHQREVPQLDGVPVIILTAQPDRVRDLPPTVRAVLSKPLVLPDLLRLVQDMCHGVPVAPRSGAPAPMGKGSGGLSARKLTPPDDEDE
jgi:two-component system, chemotaxis family, chemotaxis protein CheY